MSFHLSNEQMLERITLVVQKISAELQHEDAALLELDDDDWLTDELEVILRTGSAVLVALEARRRALRKSRKTLADLQ